MLNVAGKLSQTSSRVTSATLSISGSLSHEELVAVASRGAFYKRVTPSERRLLILLAVVAILAIALVIALAVVSYYYSRYDTGIQLCDSVECIRSAANLLQSMDRTVDPCEDFYRFSCGKWGDEHPTPDTAFENNWFADRARYTMRQIRDYLQENASDNEPIPVTQARIMFKSCMDTGELDSLGLEPMFQFLRDIGMRVRPTLPNAAGDQNPFNWFPIAVKTKKMIYQDLLIGFGVFPKDENRSVYRISIGTPDVRSPFPGYRDVDKRIEKERRKTKSKNEEDPYSAAFLEYISQAMSYIYKWKNNNTQDEDFELGIKMAALKIYELDERLTRILNTNSYSDTKEVEMSVEELQALTDSSLTGTLQLNWTEYLTLMFEDAENVTLDLEGEDKIIVSNEGYLRALSKLLSQTPSNIVELTVWWEVVHILAPLTNRDLRQLKERYIEKLTGGAPQTRSSFCASAVNYMMGMAVSYFIADPKFLNDTKKKVEDMLSDIKWAFSSLVHSVDWMDDDTKAVTLEKAAAVRNFIGFPEWLLNNDDLETYYQGVEVNETTFLLNMMNILKLYTKTMLNNLRKTDPEDGWITDPTDVNAFHTFQANAITVPAGILQFPFYGLGLEALNYGAIGTILGHELTHGFDNSGRQYDKNGNMRQWWSNATVEEYVNRTSCFIEQYNKYRLEEIDYFVNGRLTLGENIADNGGLRESLRAYRKFRERNGPEPMLPGLEEFTHEQLFFISFANVWCENWTKESLLWNIGDEHSPNHIRVIGVLSNSPEFSRIWKCPKGSTMNPQQAKCQIW